MAPLKAVIFDIGATLVTGPPVAPNKVIAGLLGNATAAEVASVIMTTPLESAEHACAVLTSAFGELSSDARDGIMTLWDSQYKAAQEIDGASQAVLELKKLGLSIGLLSDIWTPYYESVERALPQVVRAADAVVLSFRTGRRKPDNANFLRVLSDLAAEPHEAVMVGDTYEHDIQPAIELGMHTVWVLARPDREINAITRVLNREAPAPSVTVRSISDVPSAITDIMSTFKEHVEWISNT